MKIVLAPDKFKGTLTGQEFCTLVEKTIKQQLPEANILKLPLADGGDGTIEVVNYYLKGTPIKVMVNNPFFQPVEASYLFSNATKTAFIEMAEASGMKLLLPKQLDCKNATTFGTGELISNALEKGAKTILLGIGGSATNDCGIGMAAALGYRFLDKNKEVLKPIGANLLRIASIDTSNVTTKLKDVTFKIACDVSNPLYGKYGAAYVYAEQKGASKQDIELLDQGLKDFSAILDKQFNINSQHIKGAGAAGGMGIASISFLNGTLIPGVDLIKKLANFDNKIQDADWIITGEGMLDEQTFAGKTIKGVMQSAIKKNILVAVFCGAISITNKQLEAFGVSYADALLNYANNKEDAITNTRTYLQQLTSKFINTRLV